MTKVLIIDDEINNCLLLTEILEEYSELIDIFTAQFGNIGLEIAQKEKPDIIFVDRMLPVIDGLEFCRIIKEDKDLKDSTKLVIISALKNTNDETQNFADFYIQKPYKSAEITAILNKLLKP